MKNLWVKTIQKSHEPLVMLYGDQSHQFFPPSLNKTCETKIYHLHRQNFKRIKKVGKVYQWFDNSFNMYHVVRFPAHFMAMDKFFVLRFLAHYLEAYFILIMVRGNVLVSLVHIFPMTEMQL